MSGKTYYIDNNGTRHLIKKKIHINANGVPTQIKKKFFDGKNIFSSSHIVKYHVDTDDIRDIEVDDGGDAILWAPVPVRSGWIFTGWRENDEADPTVVDHKTVEEDGIELYAVFHKVITVTLQGGTNVITNTGTRYYNNSNDESPVITLGTSAISGWSLVGYRNDMTATSAVDYTAGKSYTFDESKTIYAVFNRTLTLSYNANGGSGTTASSTGTQYYNNGYYANPSITTRGSGYSRLDYKFDYWNIGSTSGSAVAAGNPVTISSNTVAYAHWSLTYNPDPNQWVKSTTRLLNYTDNQNADCVGSAYVTWGGMRYIRSVNTYVQKWGKTATGFDTNNNYVGDNRTTCYMDIYGIKNRNNIGGSLELIATKSVSVGVTHEEILGNNSLMYGDIFGTIPINKSYEGIYFVARDGYVRMSNYSWEQHSYLTWLVARLKLNF